jgi:hypothetical protein
LVSLVFDFAAIDGLMFLPSREKSIWSAISEVKISYLAKSEPAGTLILDFSIPRTVINKFMFSINYSVPVSLLWQHKMDEDTLLQMHITFSSLLIVIYLTSLWRNPMILLSFYRTCIFLPSMGSAECPSSKYCIFSLMTSGLSPLSLISIAQFPLWSAYTV